MSQIVATLSAYDTFNCVSWTLVIVDEDQQMGVVRVVDHVSGQFQGKGHSDPHDWIRDLMVDVIEST
jgi:hypothetical protein